MLENIFIELCKEYGQIKPSLWQEIETAYTEKHRHYHTLAHLQNMYEQLTLVKPQIINWLAVLFALYYHDIVYNPIKQNNEEASALLAIKRLNELNVDKETIDRTEHLILATKKHAFTLDTDTQYFLDADLSVLGQAWANYQNYYLGVRKEYNIYPDFMYKPGRKKVLQHFIQMPEIFKSDFFKEKYERQAKQNLQKEFDSLL